MEINFETNKNLIAVFSLLNRFNQAFGEPKHPLRKEIINHFKNYLGEAPKVEDYIHEYKLVVYSLSVTNIPELKMKTQLSEESIWQAKIGETIKPYLLDFYNNTDFEKYYGQYITLQLENIVINYRSIVEALNLTQILTTTWKTNVEYSLNIVTNPLTRGSFGPTIRGINYQVIGEVSDSYLPELILHEGSHPLAKRFIEPYAVDIEKYSYLLEFAQAHPKYSEAYNSWNTCFEEHLIRAVQVGLLNPMLHKSFDIDASLRLEKSSKGMVFIDTFYSEIKNGLSDKTVGNILNSLNQIFSD